MNLSSAQIGPYRHNSQELRPVEWAGLHLITRILVMEKQGRRLFEQEGLKAVPSLKTEKKR